MGQFSFSFSLLLIVLFCYVVLSLSRVKAIEPGKLMLLGWVPGLVLLSSGVIVYHQTFTFETFMLIAMSLVFFTVGAAIGTNVIRAGAVTEAQRAQLSGGTTINPFIKMTLIVLSLIYVAIMTYETATSPASFLRQGLGGLGSARETQLALKSAESGDVGLLGLIKAISRSGAIYLVLCVLLMTAKRENALRGIIIVSMIMFALEGLSTGGRSNIVFMAVFLAIAYALKRSRVSIGRQKNIIFKLGRSPIKIWHVGLGGLLAYFTFVIFPASRNAHKIGLLDRYLNFRHPSEFGAWVGALPDAGIGGSLKFFFYGTGYFSHSITKLDFFIENDIITQSYSFGFFNLKILVRLASIANEGLFFRWLQMRRNIGEVLAHNSMSSNPWSPLLRDLIIDFGLVGCVIVMFFLGLTFQYLFRRLMVSTKPHMTALAVILCSICAVSGSFGPFINNKLAFPLFLVLILAGISFLLTRVTRR